MFLEIFGFSKVLVLLKLWVVGVDEKQVGDLVDLDLELVSQTNYPMSNVAELETKKSWLTEFETKIFLEKTDSSSRVLKKIIQSLI